MVGWQVRREYFQPELTRLAEAASSIAPGISFYTLRMGDRAVGLATSRLDTVPQGFRIEEMMALELPALGQVGAAVARTRVSLTRALVMDSFAFSLDSQAGRFEASGALDRDTVLNVRIDAGGGTESLSFRLAEPPIFSAVLPVRIAAGGALDVGRQLRLPVFDPSTLSTRAVEIRVLEFDTLVVPDSAVLEEGRWRAAHFDSIPAWRIAQEFGGVEMESWIDEDGRVIRASSPLGFTMERTEYELARQAQDDARGLPVALDDDLILATAVQSEVDLGDLREVAEVRVRLSGVDLEGFQLDGGRQSLRGDTLIVRRERWEALDPAYALPYKRMDLRAALEPEPLIQSDDPRMVEAAERLTDRNLRWRLQPKEAAAKLTLGIHRMLEKRITFSVPSALQVLDSREGDCNEHTVLYVAMARSLGLPARTAVGLVHVDGAFYYHAWPEVWLGEWVAVDPTFGQYPADAGHLRFIVGGLAQQIDVARLIGRLQVEVIDRPDTPAEVEW
jgi:transglutaminase-like putative cysteine protease